MRYYGTNQAESVVLFGRPNVSLKQQVAEKLSWVLEISPGESTDIVSAYINEFVFHGCRDGSRELSARLTPAEFQQVLIARKWYKAIDEQFNYRSPRFWTRVGDAIVVNLNRERVLVLIDAHHWVE